MGFDNVNVNVSGGQNIINALQNYNTVILKPNIVDNRNVLTQEMMSERHTKYIIRWNYSLEGATINVPEDCIIEFAGGTIDNGTIVGNNTMLMYSKPIDEVCPAERQGTFIYNTTVTDEEDITSVSGQLKFKDRPATDGMGRKILRKNIIDDVNTLTQSMMQDTNTIYVIQYDFTLGEDITVPANCVLEFDGGSISGEHTITGANTGIEAGLVKIFGTAVNFSGTFITDEVYTEWYGAKNSGLVDSTLFIQKAIDFAYNTYGNIVKFNEGIYLFSTLTLKPKVQLIGSGIGVSILKQKNSSTSNGLVVTGTCTCNKLAHFTITRESGNVTSEGSGIFFEQVVGGGEHREAAYNEVVVSTPTSYKRAYINNLCVSCFQDGITISLRNYCVFIENSYIGDNDRYGLYMSSSDSSILNCYINNNGLHGLVVRGGNNKIAYIKSIFNGKADAAHCCAIEVTGYRNLISDCETQDNYCGGYRISGSDNIISNCVTNTDGYITEPKGWQEGYVTRGFLIVGEKNIFENCLITGYLFDYGALFEEAVYFQNRSDKYDVYKGFKLSIPSGKSLFRNYQYFMDNSSPTQNIGEFTQDAVNNIKHFYLTDSRYVNFDTPFISSNMTLFVNIDGNSLINGDLLVLKDVNNVQTYAIIAQVSSNGVTFLAHDNINQAAAQIAFENTTFVDAITLCASIYNNMIKLRVFAKVDDQYMFKDTAMSSAVVGNTHKKFKLLPNVKYNKVVIVDQDIDTINLIPGNSLEKYRTGAKLYISADNLNFPTVVPTYGTFADRPENVTGGFSYFCTDKQTAEGESNGIMIYYKGSNVWVDALGRVVS